MCWLWSSSEKVVSSSSPNLLFGDESNNKNVQTSHIGLSILGTLAGFLVGAFSSAISLGVAGAIILHKWSYSRETIRITAISITILGGLYGGYLVFKGHPDQFARNFFGKNRE